MPKQEGTGSPDVYYVLINETDLMFHKVIKADDLSSDDRCAICHLQYETPSKDGTTPEHAVRLPCGHHIGKACLRMCLEEGLSALSCMFCNKSIIPARYLWEQVEEIWAILNKTSPEGVRNELQRITPRGPLSYAILSLRAFVNDAPPLSPLEDDYEGLVPSFDWLLIASMGFYTAIGQYVHLNSGPGSQKIHLEALERRKHEFELSYDRYESIVKQMWVKTPNKRETENKLGIKSLWGGIGRFW